MDNLKKYFAPNEQAALNRYEKYKEKDPFPEIPPALLNSAHIQAYIAKTGLIYPYFPDDDPKKEKMTSASLILTIGPEVLYWDAYNKRQYKKTLYHGEEIKLRPNSITFLRPAERFNIPDYIAARFNLRIVHVHRGLLLGTGPLLDPGFKGYPMIPVHNLTENEYIVHVGDEFINVEFTKLSDIDYNQYSNKQNNERFDDISYEKLFRYIPNRGKTCDYDFTKYISKNVPQSKVKSSLSSVIDNAQNLINDVEKKQKWITLGLIIALTALLLGGYQLTFSCINIITDTKYTLMNKYFQHEKNIESLNAKIKTLQQQLESANSNIKTAKDGKQKN